MIRGYADRASLRPGEVLTLHVATDAPQFRTEFYRQARRLTSMGDLGLGSNPGQDAGLHGAGDDWGDDGQDATDQVVVGWRGYEFPIPDSWPSGAYIAVFTEEDQAGNPLSHPDTDTADGRDSKALFVLNSANPGSSASILYKVSLLTYQAYNMTAEPPQCLYPPNPGDAATAPADTVSLKRPGGGTGGTPHDTLSHPDVYDATSPRETFAHWDSYFIGWLEGQGYRVDYCTDVDVHQDDGTLLPKYRLLLSVGHDEYWSDAMYSNVSRFIGNGGNAAFFSANTCWWQVLFANGDSAFSRGENFFKVGKPENQITGVSYRNGGGQWDGPRPELVGFTVQHADHWVYQGTGLQNGQVFGDYYGGNHNDPAALVGYECDGALFDRGQLGAAEGVVASFSDGTPASFVILGIADVTGWEDYADGNFAATMGVYFNGGTVFTAATSDWARVLASGKDPAVERVTRNVIDRLST